MSNYVGEYYSKEWIQKNVLMLSDEDINNMAKEMQYYSYLAQQLEMYHQYH